MSRKMPILKLHNPLPTSAIYFCIDVITHWQACMSKRIDLAEQAEVQS